MSLTSLLKPDAVSGGTKPPVLTVGDIKDLAGKVFYVVDIQEFEMSYDNNKPSIRYRVVISNPQLKQTFTVYLSKTRAIKLLKGLQTAGYLTKDHENDTILKAELLGSPVQVTFDTVINPRNGRTTEVVLLMAALNQQKYEPHDLLKYVIEVYTARILTPEMRDYASRLLGKPVEELMENKQQEGVSQPTQSVVQPGDNPLDAAARSTGASDDVVDL